MNTVLLQTTYFGPIQWYQKLYRYDHILSCCKRLTSDPFSGTRSCIAMTMSS